MQWQTVCVDSVLLQMGYSLLLAQRASTTCRSIRNGMNTTHLFRERPAPTQSLLQCRDLSRVVQLLYHAHSNPSASHVLHAPAPLLPTLLVLAAPPQAVDAQLRSQVLVVRRWIGNVRHPGARWQFYQSTRAGSRCRRTLTSLIPCHCSFSTSRWVCSA
jgi:hypothetical protein